MNSQDLTSLQRLLFNKIPTLHSVYIILCSAWYDNIMQPVVIKQSHKIQLWVVLLFGEFP